MLNTFNKSHGESQAASLLNKRSEILGMDFRNDFVVKF